MAAAAPSSSQALDFEALLSRDYRPARVSRLVINDLYQQPPQAKQHSSATARSAGIAASWNNTNKLKEDARKKRLEEEETSKLVMSLVSHTPAFTRHLPLEEQLRLQKESSSLLWNNKNLHAQQQSSLVSHPRNIPSEFHLVNLMDWEKQIDWDGSIAAKIKTSDPLELIRRPRNAMLDNLTFDSSCFDGDTETLLQKARQAPLILELSVAGQSVANQVYQNSVLTAQRPPPATQTDEYQNRLDRDWSGNLNITSTAELSSPSKAKGSLQAKREAREADFAERQKKRAAMAIDKTSRVTQALATVAAMGGGRGRTITSSLMGPGGTERTGRPSRQSGSASHEAEYVEQLDMIMTHSLSRDLSQTLLRQFHRPKLPLRLVRQDVPWQLQVRYVPTGKKGTDESKTSYQSIMMGTQPGAISRNKIRAESDLSPTEGQLVLVEYVEERPPIFLNKGMASKIVNYYRGDKARCPVSAGGGDRPARRKRDGESGSKDTAQNGRERLPRLDGLNRKTSVMDWVGKIPKRSQKERTEQDAIDVLPEGVTEILHPKQHGPFLGEVDEGVTVTGMLSNLFVAPMFRHEPESTDFLMILGKSSGTAKAGERDVMGVVLRDFPASCFTVGQTEPRARVHAPNSQGEKNFLGPWISYHVARALTRSQAEGGGLSYEELVKGVLPNLDIQGTLRQRLKQVAEFDKNTQIWTTKPIGRDDYQGLEVLGREIPPEGEACFESARAASRRLADLGLNQLITGTHTVTGISLIFVYLASQLNTVRDLCRKTRKLAELSRSNKSIQPSQLAYYEKAASDFDILYKSLRQRNEIAQFIYEELQLTPWNLTGEFIEVHRKGEGTGMMKLTGLGDPSGQGEGFSFLREADAKPVKSIGTSNAFNEEVKKITGTDCDLRKLTMKQMAAILRHYGMEDKNITPLKRWDRVHIIRDLSTKFASDGMGDGLERFARGEKLKLSEQKQIYHDRIQVIWKRQLASLSMDPSDKTAEAAGPGGSNAADASTEDAFAGTGQLKNNQSGDKEEESSDSDSDDDDDLAAALEEEMIHRAATNELVAAHAVGGKDIRNVARTAEDKELTMDARDFAALKRQREEDRQTQEGLQAMGMKDDAYLSAAGLSANRKVVRKRITKIHPDGRQVTIFKFIVQPQEVGKVIARLQGELPEKPDHVKEVKYEYLPDEKPPGHAMFQDDDAFRYDADGRSHSNRRRTPGKKKDGQSTSRNKAFQFGKLKAKISTEERMRKRQREEDEFEVYSVSVKRKGTSNRRERGSIRERAPHVIFAEKLESIRSSLESRPGVHAFLKPVSRKLYPKYYEVISHPMDLSTIRERISRYDYRTTDAMLKDFELMKNNAARFNGPVDVIAVEAAAIYDSVRGQIESQRADLSELEEAVKEQLDVKPKKKRRKNNEEKKVKSSCGTTAKVGGLDVFLGDVSHFHGGDSDSDDS